MSVALYTQVKPASSPSFTPMQIGLQSKCASNECEERRKKRLTLQRSPTNQAEPSEVPPIVHEVLRSPGKPLDQETRAFIGSHLGHDFSRVTVYSNRSPAKALSALPEEKDKENPSPMQGSATIQCNGSGDYEIIYGGWAGAACGTKNCVTIHESSHIADWKAKWPTGCQGQPKGYLPKGGPQYKDFLKKSECKAHTVDLACAEALPKPAGCDKTVEDYIKLTRDQKANWCPAVSRSAKVAIGIGGGALVGAGIGALAGGPVGAAIGAGIGALVGGIAGLLI